MPLDVPGCAKSSYTLPSCSGSYESYGTLSMHKTNSPNIKTFAFIDLDLQDMPRLQKSDKEIPAGNNYASSFAADSNVNSVILDHS